MMSCASAAVACRPDVIDGIATMTMKKSSSARKEPTNRHASAHHRLGSMFSIWLGGVETVAVIDGSCFICLYSNLHSIPIGGQRRAIDGNHRGTDNSVRTACAYMIFLALNGFRNNVTASRGIDFIPIDRSAPRHH
jgi:hypothetical protein